MDGIQGIAHAIVRLWEPLFQLFTHQEYIPDFLINLTFTSFEGSFIILLITQLFLSEQQHSHPENKPFHFQVDSTVLLPLVTRNAQLLLVLLCRHVLLDNKNVYARAISKKFSKYSAFV